MNKSRRTWYMRHKQYGTSWSDIKLDRICLTSALIHLLPKSCSIKKYGVEGGYLGTIILFFCCWVLHHDIKNNKVKLCHSFLLSKKRAQEYDAQCINKNVQCPKTIHPQYALVITELLKTDNLPFTTYIFNIINIIEILKVCLHSQL